MMEKLSWYISVVVTVIVAMMKHCDQQQHRQRRVCLAYIHIFNSNEAGTWRQGQFQRLWMGSAYN